MAPQELREEHVRKESLRFLVKKQKPVPRPVTPRVEEPPEVSSCLTLSSLILYVSEIGFVHSFYYVPL